MKLKFFAACLGMLMLSEPVLAAPDSYDVMRQLAAEEFGTFSGGGISLQLPKMWKIHANAQSVRFQVPYHEGVMGGIEIGEAVSSTESALNWLSGHLGSAFEVSRQAPFVNDQIKGERLVLQGRPGGATWRVLAFAGTVGAGSQPIFYFAIAPEAWFSTYEVLFDSILNSLN